MKMKELIAHQVHLEYLQQPKDASESSLEQKPASQSPDSISPKEENSTVDSKVTITSPSNSRKPGDSDSKLPPAKRAKVKRDR